MIKQHSMDQNRGLKMYQTPPYKSQLFRQAFVCVGVEIHRDNWQSDFSIKSYTVLYTALYSTTTTLKWISMWWVGYKEWRVLLLYSLFCMVLHYCKLYCSVLHIVVYLIVFTVNTPNSSVQLIPFCFLEDIFFILFLYVSPKKKFKQDFWF